MINILFFGGGNQCLETINYLKDISKFSKEKFNIKGIVDPQKIDKKSIEETTKKIKHYFNLKNLDFDKKNLFAIVAIGDADKREKCRIEIKKSGIKLFTVIHPTSYVATSSKIGQGCIICPFTLIAPKAHIEENVLMNSYASIGHHGFVGKSSVISPYATLNGQAYSGKMSFLGTNSVIMAKAKLGNYSKLSAGSILYKKTGDKCLVTGNPAAEIILKFKSK